jgi:HIP---CoA ligase
MRADLGFQQIITAYGLTESSGTVTMCSLSDLDAVVEQTSGRPLPGVQVVIRDPDGTELPTGTPGEICVRSPNVMAGYLDDPARPPRPLTPTAGCAPGTSASSTRTGYLHITDRLKDMFIVGGLNAYPAEIERLLSQHPAVSQAAVIGVPDDWLGESAART